MNKIPFSKTLVRLTGWYPYLASSKKESLKEEYLGKRAVLNTDNYILTCKEFELENLEFLNCTRRKNAIFGEVLQGVVDMKGTSSIPFWIPKRSVETLIKQKRTLDSVSLWVLPR